MWGSILSALTSDIPREFPYSIDRSAVVKDELTIMQRTTAVHKSDETEANAYIFDKKTGTPEDIEFVRRVVKNAKTVRHPFIVSVLEVLETAVAFYVITERVTKLSECLADHDARALAAETMPWNLKCISEALQFLHETANLTHGSLSIESICCCVDSQWKIGLMETALEARTTDEIRRWVGRHPLRILYSVTHPKYSLTNDSQPSPNQPAYVCDRIMFASLVSFLHAACSNDSISSSLSRWSYDAHKNSLPNNIRKFTQALVESARSDGFDWTQQIAACTYFTAPIVGIMGFFKDFALKGNWDKERFLDSTLNDAISQQRVIVQTRVLLPRVARLFREESLLPTTLRPAALRCFARLLGNAGSYTEAEFNSLAWPSVLELFKDPQRSTRYVMLQTLGRYENLLSQSQDEVLLQLILPGLLDTSMELRDATLRSVASIIPRLPVKNSMVNNALKTIIGLIQQDASEQIRTNGVICLSRLATIFPADKIAPGVITGVNDSFPPCRLAAIQCIQNIAGSVSPKETANTYIPALSRHLLDSDPECSRAAYHAIKDLLEKWSENPATKAPESKGTFFKISNDAIYSTLWGRKNSSSTSPTKDTDARRDDGALFEDAISPEVNSASDNPDVMANLGAMDGGDISAGGGPILHAVENQNSKPERYSAMDLSTFNGHHDGGQLDQAEPRSGRTAKLDRRSGDSGPSSKESTWGNPVGVSMRMSKTSSLSKLASDLVAPSPESLVDQTETDFWNGMDGDERGRVVKRSLKSKRKPAAIE